MTTLAKLLIVATTFPHRSDSQQPRFVLDLCKSVSATFQQRVIVPSGTGLVPVEIVEDLDVRRFRYFLKKKETLAYGSGIMANLKSQPLRWALLPFFMMSIVLATARQVRKYKPDVIHAHWWFPAGFAVVIALKLIRSECPLVVTCHGGDYYVVGKKFPRLMRWVLQQSDLIAMVSTAMLKDAISAGINSAKLQRSPMGVDLSKRFFTTDGKREGVIYVGRLVEKKGVDVLLRAWSLCPESVRRNGLTIIGDGEQQHYLLALADRLAITDTVRFASPVSHEKLPEVLNSAKLLVFPSVVAEDNDQEGLGLVPIEAMGCGCPVLASDIPPLHDVIETGVNGEFFEMGNEHQLAKSLTELMSNKSQLQEYSENGRSSVLHQYDWPRIGETYSSMYQQLIDTERHQ